MSNFKIEINKANFDGVDPSWNFKWHGRPDVYSLSPTVQEHLPDFEKRIRKYLKAVYKWRDIQLGSEFDWGYFYQIAYNEDLEEDLVNAGTQFLKFKFVDKHVRKDAYEKFSALIAAEIALGLAMRHAGEISVPSAGKEHWVDWEEFNNPRVDENILGMDTPVKEKTYTYVLTLRRVHCLPVLHVWRNLSEEEYDRRIAELHMPFVDLHMKLADDSLAGVQFL